jgi:hypothetical protein
MQLARIDEVERRAFGGGIEVRRANALVPAGAAQSGSSLSRNISQAMPEFRRTLVRLIKAAKKSLECQLQLKEEQAVSYRNVRIRPIRCVSGNIFSCEVAGRLTPDTDFDRKRYIEIKTWLYRQLRHDFDCRNILMSSVLLITPPNDRSTNRLTFIEVSHAVT